MDQTTSDRPRIAIAPDVHEGRIRVSRAYVARVFQAGGLPLILPCEPGFIDELAPEFDGFILTGGDDPIMEQWDIPTHPKATKVDPARQTFDLALLDWLAVRPDVPVFGVCLGMQYMTLHAGGKIDQHLPDTLATADDHWDKREHSIEASASNTCISRGGSVHSHHRQAMTDPGTLHVIATAPDGVIEAVQAVDQPFYVGVQWHPERTGDASLGEGLFRQFVVAAVEYRMRRMALLLG